MNRNLTIKRHYFLLALIGALVLAAALVLSGKPVNIGTDRRFVWDSRIIDSSVTTASRVFHSPAKQGRVLYADSPWEGNVADSFNVVPVGDGYRMYYSSYNSFEDVKICCAESSDGISWYKPQLGIVNCNGSTENNIVFDSSEGITGGFFVFCDSSPRTKENEIFKAMALKTGGIFACYVSRDGINWEPTGNFFSFPSAEHGDAVSLSSVFWYEKGQEYRCYFVDVKEGKQQIMLSCSKDFEKWSKPKKIKAEGMETYGIRTANIVPYFRNENMLVGLPLRAVKIPSTVADANFPRNSLKTADITDAVFVFSADGKNYSATEDAVLTPGPQNGSNWIFGDCFVAGGFAQTPSIHSDRGQDYEISLYAAEKMLSNQPTSLYRYTLRTDGFASYHAPYETKKVVTQPLKFEGDRMTVNFSTSTDGYVYVRILDKNGKPFDSIEYTAEDGSTFTVPEYTSYRLTGDRVDREVMFNGDISALIGKTVVIEFYLSDADIYSFGFDCNEYITPAGFVPEEIEIRTIEKRQDTYGRQSLNIGSDRQLFLDDMIINTEKTDAVLVSHSPERAEEIFRTDLPWEGDNCDFYVILDDVDDEGKLYHRMYYLGWDSSDFTDIRVCYAYSYDGSRWIKPSLGLHSFTDKNTGRVYTDTNIVLYTEEEIFDNFFVMKDTRPGVPDSRRYKAICQGRYDQLGYSSYGLWAWISPDGFHWTKTHRVLPQLEEWFGSFDSVNSLVWDDDSQQFFTYFRVREEQELDGVQWIDFRKIYGATGPDFVPFETDAMFELDYGQSAPVFEMYTNNIIKYSRAPQMFLGFPTRFTRNNEWEKNYEYLSDPVTRRKNYDSGQLTRTLSMTDTMFMSSRDGRLWSRLNEAWITPGPEYQANWIYGNCYPAYGLVETTVENPSEDRQLSTYLFEGKFYKEPSVLYRYTLRMDGFTSYKGSSCGSRVVTKPLTFTGEEMLLNFRTSAAGSVTVNILDETGNLIDGYASGVLIGDNTDRQVLFAKDLSQLNGRKVVVEFVLKDAEIFSFKFR